MVKIEPPTLDEDDDEEKLDHRKRKRNRTIRSCVPCHNHKRKVCFFIGLNRSGELILVRSETTLWTMYGSGIGESSTSPLVVSSEAIADPRPGRAYTKLTRIGI